MNKYKISLILNIIIVLLVTLGTVFMITGFRFMSNDLILSVSSIEAFKFFTVDSNLLIGIASLIFIYYDCLVISKKKKEIPKYVYIFKHIATVGVILTFLVTAFYLAPFSKYNYFAFYKNSNLFFHLIVPILSFITYVFFEKNKKQERSIILLGTIPMILYSIFYVIAYLIHLGSDSIKDYDWYNLIGNGVIGAMISIIVMYVLTYFISYTIWFLNKKSK